MKILYICTHNRCRSILSEALTNHFASDQIIAKSAGSQPAGIVHPLTIHYLQQAQVPVAGLRSQSWHDFEDFAPDVVITVCDAAAGESCPVWFGKAIKVHWGLADPSKVDGSEDEQRVAFQTCIEAIKHRVIELIPLAEQQLSGQSLKEALAQLGAN